MCLLEKANCTCCSYFTHQLHNSSTKLLALYNQTGDTLIRQQVTFHKYWDLPEALETPCLITTAYLCFRLMSLITWLSIQHYAERLINGNFKILVSDFHDHTENVSEKADA